ncbi:MAG TPA: DNA topoisomerase I [Candidatus Methanoculleus thermohydrogenotrophicum]|nr:DNA topoisomerase I [Candidatus Methanoculleus thermohydrogenotrophicum]NLM82351.1 DNA topoisomerase I [Candidatus Methanoculleus thermohydrogenotrophicum]HOB18828.1 DNA topoisomerase I [Candidatus Methanoculleus thermohydrogenotrophicum]
MHLIIAEKNISAKRIAQILAGNEKVRSVKEGGVSTYSFDSKTVVGLRGHVVEVDFEPGYTNWRSETHTPRTLIDAGTVKKPTEKKIVNLIQRLAKKADLVTIATDYDTEGELIGKEAYDLIRAVNPEVPINRARFSAITPAEIRAAFENPGDLDFALAAAGEARQMVDLMWGASLTRFISLAARRGGRNILSVGRVQSPTLAMIVDREREIENFVPQTYWLLSLMTEKDGQPVEARHTAGRFTDHDAALAAEAGTKEPLVVVDVKERVRNDRAPTPFDTTTFIVAAGRLGFSAANAMRLAEDLYMNGYISYPRTDNTVYPKSLDLNAILETLRGGVFDADVAWVQKNRRPTPTRGKKESTDHPPIHPTGAATPDALGQDRWKVYELIVRRFLATLSPDARWATLRCTFDASGEPYAATGSRLLSAGWRQVYPYSEAKEKILPPLTPGERLPILEVNLEEKETQPPPRYSQSRLIQVMEELGLGTKSTRHEVIGKLISRRYVEGDPLRPTLVGRAVTDALDNHAATITEPEMTRTLEEHMQLIKQRERSRDDVINESREMLHQVFDKLEAHEEEIGEEIMEQTAEEHTVGPCPVCGHDLRIRHIGVSQFIGCTGYPECRFNISLPGSAWGRAIRIEETCEEHGLSHVRLIRKGSRPWTLGCPLCSHIQSNIEALQMMPSMTDDLMRRLHAHHIYTVSEIAGMQPADLGSIGVSTGEAERLIREAGDALEVLRRRSELKKFIRKIVPPRKGRSHAKIMRSLLEQGIGDIRALSQADPALLKKAGIGDAAAKDLLEAARALCDERVLQEAGVPAVSLKKYRAEGLASPNSLCHLPIPYLSIKTGINPETVHRHVELVCNHLGRPVPAKITKAMLERGRKDLLAIPGIGEATLQKLYLAGIYDAATLREADPEEVSSITGIAKTRLHDFILRAEGAERGRPRPTGAG